MTTLHARTVCAAFAVGALALVQAPTAAIASGAFTVTIRSTANPVLTGHSYAITGHVSPAANGRPVVLQRYYSGAWHTIKTATLSSSSNYLFALTSPAVRASETFRVLKAASGTYAIGKSAGLVERVTTQRYSVSAHMPAAVQLRGEVFDVTGVVSPSASGATVYLQHQSASGWTTIASGALSSSSTFSVRTTAGSPGVASYRIVKPASAWVVGGVSGSGAVTSTSDHLNVNEVLAPNAYLASAYAGEYGLVMQGDGNLVEYFQGRALWASNTAGHPGAYAVMQGDGNLVVYDAAGALWASNTAGHSGAWFAVQVDANLVVYSASGTALWASSTVNDHLTQNQTLTSGQYLLSSGGTYMLVMQGDGNLVEYQAGTARWASNTAGHPSAYVVMQGDGNLVVYDASGALWASNTAGHAGSWFADQTDGNLVVYSSGGAALWASNTAQGGGSGGITFGTWSGSAGPQYAASTYGYPYPNSPDCDEYGSGGCVADMWGFFQGQCTSWVAYRISQLNGIAFNNWYRQPSGYRWGDATSWKTAADRAGFATNGTPAVGSVAWYSSGHVAYVERVDSPTSVVISEMNVDLHNGFRVRTITTASGWPTGFIHIRDR